MSSFGSFGPPEFESRNAGFDSPNRESPDPRRKATSRVGGHGPPQTRASRALKPRKYEGFGGWRPVSVGELVRTALKVRKWLEYPKMVKLLLKYTKQLNF